LVLCRDFGAPFPAISNAAAKLGSWFAGSRMTDTGIKQLEKGRSWRIGLPALSILLPFLLFLMHAWLFRGWIMDDAGISFSYARNLAQGHGLVAQPGIKPVEGFSNFTWVVFMAPFLALHWFDPQVTPKVLSWLLVFASFIVTYRTLLIVSAHPVVGAFLVLTLVSLNTSFVVWTTSGLENPLYVLLVCLLLWQLVALGSDPTHGKSAAISIAIVSALCALTRPDGILYSLAFPIVLSAATVTKACRARDAAKRLLVNAGVLSAMLGAYMAFRLTYFGDILPNTYYAKTSIVTLVPETWYAKALELIRSLEALHYPFYLLLAVGVCFLLLRRLGRAYFRTLILLTLALAIYVLLPADWMGEYRFATPFFFLCYMASFQVGEAIVTASRLGTRSRNALAALAAVLLLVANTANYYGRSIRFISVPPAPFSLVAEDFGIGFNRLAAQIGAADASVLLPDVGGTLFYSDLRVYDLGGLTDRTIATTLGRDQTAFHNYVFTTLRPTFIHTHGPWTYLSDFDGDPRFRRDYWPINEYVDDFVRTQYKSVMFSGDYVRRDALRNQGQLLQLRALWH
jgi:hypothetical protein